jgi:anthranilate phosphoribosyltransferase
MIEQDPVKALIKKVGRGKTLAKDLTREEAAEAMERLLRGEFTAAQAGAFLQAMRIKETVVHELVGAAQAAARFRNGEFPPQPESLRNPLVVNLAFDTARKGGVLSLAALAFLKRENLVDSMVVWERATLFQAPGSMERTIAAMESNPSLSNSVPHMVEVRSLCEPWQNLSGLRKELGFRSILNTVEKLLRPWETAPVVVGISHDTFSERLCHVLFALGSPRGAVVRGHHGTCDLGFGEKPTAFNAWNGEDLSESVIEGSVFPWEKDASALLMSSLDSWGALLADESSALWGMVRAQASFFHSVATGAALSESVQIIQNLSQKEQTHA